MNDPIKILNKGHIRVFISSTFIDMMEEREYLIKKIFPIVRKKCKERLVEFTEIDLRWGITEEEASQGKVIDICLSEIDKSKPYFIGIIGGRYGWIPEDTALNNFIHKKYNFQRISITELEIQYGALSGENSSDARIYIKNPEIIDLQFREPKGSEASKKLEKLKSNLMNQDIIPIKQFNSIEELGQMVLEDLLQIIEERYPINQKPSALELLRREHMEFLLSRIKTYIPDKEQFKYIDNHVKSSEGPLIITGETGVGKSTLLCNWIKHYKEKMSDVHFFYHFVGSARDSTDHHKLMWRLVSELKEEFQFEELIPENHEELEVFFLNFISRIPTTQKFIFVIDALNQLEEQDHAHLLNWLPVKYPPHVKLIVSTLSGTILDSLRKRRYRELHVLKFDTNKQKQFIKKYLELYGKKLNKKHIELLLKNSLMENPLILQTLLGELRMFGKHEFLEQFIRNQVVSEDADQYFSDFLSRLEKDYKQESMGFELVSIALSYLATAKDGLSEFELLEVSRIPQLYWSFLSNALENHLIIRGGRLNFAHDFFRIAVEKKYFFNFAVKRKFHLKLANYFDQDSSSLRSIEELPYHLLMAREYERLKNYLSRINIFRTLFSVDEKASIHFDKHKLVMYWKEIKDIDITSAYRESLRKWIKLEDPDINERFNVLWSLASFMEMCGHYKESIDYNMQALLLLETCDLNINLDAQSLIYNNLGVNYIKRGSYKLALEYLENALMLCLRIYKDAHFNTAQTYNNLGILYTHKAEYSKALKFHEKCLKVRKILFEENHPDMAQSYNNIGMIYLERAEYDKAFEYLERALEIRKNFFGEFHSDVALQYDNLGVLFGARAEFDKALEFFKYSLDIRRKIYGEIHPETCSSYINIGQYFTEKAEYVKAMTYIKKAIYIFHEFQENFDLTIISSTYSKLANIFLLKGEYDRALPYYKQELDLLLKVHGPSHPSIGMVYNAIGTLYQNKGKYDEALPYHEKALDLLLKVHGPSHPSIGMVYIDIGTLYQNKGEYDEALLYHEKALDLLLKHYGSSHKRIGKVYNAIGEIYIKKNMYDQAITYHRNALNLRLKIFGEINSEVAISYNNIGSIFRDQAQYDKALKYYKKALNVWLKTEGPSSQYVALSYNNIGSAYMNKNEIELALEYLEKALNHFIALRGEFHPDVALIYNNIGYLYGEKGQLDKNALLIKQAIEYLEKALSIRLKTCGKLHPDVLVTQSNLGSIYINQKDYHKAKNYLEPALEGALEVHGKYHNTVATLYNNLASIYYNLDSRYSFSLSISYYEEALDIWLKIHGKYHPDVSLTYMIIGDMYSFIEDHQKTLDHYHIALDIITHMYGKNHHEVATTYNDIGITYLKKGDLNEALDNLNIACSIRQELFKSTNSPHYLLLNADCKNLIEQIKSQLGH